MRTCGAGFLPGRSWCVRPDLAVDPGNRFRRHGEVFQAGHLAARTEFAQPLDGSVKVVAIEFVDRDERAVAVDRREPACGNDSLDRGDLCEMRVVVPLVVLGFAVGRDRHRLHVHDPFGHLALSYTPDQGLIFRNPPASTRSCCPVTYRAASLARNSTASLMSSGST